MYDWCNILNFQYTMKIQSGTGELEHQ